MKKIVICFIIAISICVGVTGCSWFSKDKSETPVEKGTYGDGYVSNLNITIDSDIKDYEMTFSNDEIKSENGTEDSYGIIINETENGKVITGYTGYEINIDLSSSGYDDIVAITGFSKEIQSIKLPNNVRYISGFNDMSYLTTITLPNSVEYLGNGAFQNCKNLTKVEFSTSLKQIYPYAFKDCENLKTADFSVCENLECIYGYAFDNTALTSADLSKTKLKKILGLTKCSKLNSVVLSSEPIQLMFDGSAIKNITIPKSVQTLSFTDCSNLEKVNFEENSEIKIISASAFSNCKKLSGTFTIPKSVLRIGSSAFYNCKKITAIVFEEGSQIKEICPGAFSRVEICSIKLPDSIEYIGRGAFINLYDDFKTNNVMQHIFIPKSIKFIHASQTPTIYVEKGAEFTEGTYIEGEESNTTATIVIDIIRDAILVDNVIYTLNKDNYYEVKGSAYSEAITIQDKIDDIPVKEIGASIFAKRHDLKAVKLGNYINKIGERAFYQCSNLAKFQIQPQSRLVEIGEYAFYETFNMREFYIPKCTVTIAKEVFWGAALDVDFKYKTIYAEGASASSGWNSKWNNYGSLIIDRQYTTVYNAKVSNNGFIYTVDGSNATIKNYCGISKELTISTKLDDTTYNITNFNSTFSDDGYVENITFNNINKTIEQDTFSFTYFKSIKFVNSVLILNENAFSGISPKYITFENCIISLNYHAFCAVGDSSVFSFNSCSISTIKNGALYKLHGKLSFDENCTIDKMEQNCISATTDISEIEILCSVSNIATGAISDAQFTKLVIGNNSNLKNSSTWYGNIREVVIK